MLRAGDTIDDVPVVSAGVFVDGGTQAVAGLQQELLAHRLLFPALTARS